MIEFAWMIDDQDDNCGCDTSITSQLKDITFKDITSNMPSYQTAVTGIG
jgi:hypothetical protein